MAGKPLIPLDTTPEMAALQLQAYRDMGMDGRLRIALELSDLTHAFALAGVRQRRAASPHRRRARTEGEHRSLRPPADHHHRHVVAQQLRVSHVCHD